MQRNKGRQAWNSVFLVKYEENESQMWHQVGHQTPPWWWGGLEPRPSYLSELASNNAVLGWQHLIQRCHRYCWIKFPALKDNYEAKSSNGNLFPLYFQIASCDVWNADQYGAVRVNQTEEPIIRWIGAFVMSWPDLSWPHHPSIQQNTKKDKR